MSSGSLGCMKADYSITEGKIADDSREWEVNIRRAPALVASEFDRQNVLASLP
jgi:hypothetical protein